MQGNADGDGGSAARLLRGMLVCRAMLRMRIFEIDDGWHEGEEMGVPVESYRHALDFAMRECDGLIRALQDLGAAPRRNGAGRKPRGPRSSD